MAKPILYDYFRSSAAYRVRIALNLKGIDYERRRINLLDDQQKLEEYTALNAQGLIPTLELDGKRLTQSLAIIDYLDAIYPDPPLVPFAPAERAHVLTMALVVACDIHPINNLRVLRELKNKFGHSQGEADEWYRHWVREGLRALEALAAPAAGSFLFGDSPTVADICLVPQLYNARRYAVPVEAYPALLRAESSASELKAFASAHPHAQDVAA